MNIIIAGGGTGGHLFPGIAVYEKLKDLDKNAVVFFIGTEKGIENRIKNEYNLNLSIIAVSGFAGKNFMNKIRAIKDFLKASKDIRKIYKERKPEFVLGLGGYISLMPLIMARLKGIRSGVMEQNLIPGMTVKILGLIGITVFASYEGTKKYLPFSSIIVTGNPVRESIINLRHEQLRHEQKFGREADNPKNELSIFIFGGSQGASSINSAVMIALRLLPDEIMRNLMITHQTGEKDFQAVQEFYERINIKKSAVFSFIKNIENYYADSDIVVSRAGAGTLSELVALRKPAILIPYPHAARNHQEKNASPFSESGCFVVIRDDENLSKILLQKIDKIFYNRQLINNMQNNLAKMDFEDPALKIANIIIQKN